MGRQAALVINPDLITLDVVRNFRKAVIIRGYSTSFNDFFMCFASCFPFSKDPDHLLTRSPWAKGRKSA